MAETQNLGRMEINELVNHLAEAKAALKNPGMVALRLCECCINVSMPSPEEVIRTKVEVADPVDARKVTTLSIK